MVLFQIGWRPILAGLATLIVGVIAGFGLAGETSFTPARWARWWLDRVIMRVLQDRRWFFRTAGLFVNNAVLIAGMIAAGGLAGGAWAAVLVIGLFMGMVLRLLGEAGPSTPANPVVVDRWVRIGLLLNMLEFPALGVAVGLSMGQRAAPNGLVSSEIWRLYGLWVVPALLLAAVGESLWIGRLDPFKPDDS